MTLRQRFAAGISGLLLLTLPVLAAPPKKSDPGPHPIKVLKITINNNRADMSSTRGDMSVWLQNTSDVAVDKVKVTCELYSERSGRLIETKNHDIGNLDPGKKSMFDFRWDCMGEGGVKPRIWVYYNGGLDRLTQFEGIPDAP